MKIVLNGFFCIILIVFLTFYGIDASERPIEVEIDKEEAQEVSGKKETFFEEEVDYSRFVGRVTDRDLSKKVIKVFSKNGNIKFLVSGDKVLFELHSGGDGQCKGYVRGTEKNYFVLSVQDLNACWKEQRYFRRGTILKFNSPDLEKRVKEASLYRLVLLKRKKDFLKQLGKVNDFIWAFNQRKVSIASEFDRDISQLEKRKLKSLQLLNSKRKDQLNLQRELVYRLDALDKDLNFYLIEKFDTKLDRWNADHNLGLPVGERPQNLTE